MVSASRTAFAMILVIALSIPCIAADEPKPAAGAAADAQVVQGTMSGQVLAAGGGRVVRFAADGKVLWDFKGGHTHDAWLLPSGNVLYAGGEFVREVTPDKKIVFEYKPANQEGGGVYSCQRLENGNTLIGENSTGRVLEVDKDGHVAFQLQTDPFKEGEHHNLRMVRKLANGNYLVCHSGAHLVKEYTPTGKVGLGAEGRQYRLRGRAAGQWQHGDFQPRPRGRVRPEGRRRVGLRQRGHCRREDLSHDGH